MRRASKSIPILISWGSVALSVLLWKEVHPAVGLAFALLTGTAYAFLNDVPAFGKITKTGGDWEEARTRRGCATSVVIFALATAMLGSLAAVGAAHLTGFSIIVPVGVCSAIHTCTAGASVFAVGLLRRKSSSS